MGKRRTPGLFVLLALLAVFVGTWFIVRGSARTPAIQGAAVRWARGKAGSGPQQPVESTGRAQESRDELAPVRVPAHVKVRILAREGGTPIPGASVRLSDEASEWRGIADDTGAVLFECVEMGPVNVSADAPGYVGLQLAMVLGPGKNPDEPLRLSPAGHLVLAFTSSLDGSPVAGARVFCSEAESVTGADGTARLPGGAAASWAGIEVKAEGFLRATGRVLLSKDTTVDTRAEFCLDPEGRIRGRILDPAGKPVVGLKVRASVAVPEGARGVREWAAHSHWGGDTASMIETGEPTPVAPGPDGTFTLEGLLAGGLYEVGAMAERGVWFPDPVVASAGPEPPFLELVFNPGVKQPAQAESPGWTSLPPETAFLRGTVVDETGRPVAGTVVQIGYLGPIGSGDPAEEGLLQFETWPLYEDEKTDGEGRFSRDQLPAGRWRIVALPRDSVGFASPVFVEAPAEGLRIVAVERLPGALTGRIVADPKHSRWHGLDFLMATIRLRADPTPVRGDFDSVANAKEGFRIDGVPAGDVSVSLRIPGFLPWRSSVEMPEKGNVDLGEIHLEPAPGITGRVADGDGHPVPGALVRRADRWNPEEGVFTDAAGRFTLEDLDAGETRVLVEAAGFPPLHTRVDAGVPGEKILVLRRGSVLRAVILDSGGRPLPRLPVRLRSGGEGGRTRWCIADPRGRIMDHLPEGTWEIAVFFSAGRPGDPPDIKQEVVLHDGQDAEVRVSVAR